MSETLKLSPVAPRPGDKVEVLVVGPGRASIETSDLELVQRAVRNARPRQPGAHVRWAAVRDTFAVGSTSAVALCRRFGLDPDEKVHGAPCETCADREQESNSDG